MKYIQIQQLGKQDANLFRKLLKRFQNVFEMTDMALVSDDYLKSLLAAPSFVVFVAINENEVIGGLTGHEIPLYYAEASEMFIYDIAIEPVFQRKGIGKMLLQSLASYCKENNIREMFVAANEEDDHALNFYHSSGGQSERVIHFNYP
ncbi:MAG TPA: GNAT family N-acetyltransferase, partial [Bacteroidia bacterium]|nr:GNAT family N-acetyltransferase [Bacteroidia bacterium]